MTLKSKVHEDAARAELSKADAREFYDRLDAFGETLGEKERVLLAVMVVEALAGEEEAPAAEEAATIEPPTEDEFTTFAKKLSEFHDSLPGDQHLLVDAMLAKTWFRDQAEVEGFHWRLLDRRRVGYRQFRAYEKACLAAGGDQATWSSPKLQGYDGGLRVACWDWTHNN